MNKYKSSAVENGSVRFDKVDGIEFWFTPLNRIF